MAGRPRFQMGQITVRGGSWVLRYRDYASGGGRKDRRLGLVADNPDIRESETGKAEVRFADKIAKCRAEINQGHTNNIGGLILADFIEQSYFPRLDWRMKVPAGNEMHIEPSTINSYRDIFKIYVRNSATAKIKLRDFTSRDGQRFQDSLSQELSHQTHLRIKNFVRGVFTWAIADGAYDGVNPMEAIKAGGWSKKSSAPSLAGLPGHERIRREKIRESNKHAYTLEEVADMLDKLTEPSRTLCAVAAFTGLTRSELRGLKWDDYDERNSVINVQRKVWAGDGNGMYIGATKTDAREAAVTVIPVLKKILKKYKQDSPRVGEGWMFRGEKLLRPLDLDNISRRDIPQHINGAWFGWHAFRRGLGTRLNEMGVDDKDIQLILRHADVSTTTAYYILPNIERAKAGMKKFGAMAQKKYGIKV
jgi:integrase